MTKKKNKIQPGHCPECGNVMTLYRLDGNAYCDKCQTLFGEQFRPAFNGYVTLGGDLGCGKEYLIRT